MTPTTEPAVHAAVRVRPGTTFECAARCDELGMRLGAVVLIHDAAGCVCEPGAPMPATPSSTPTTSGASAVAGEAVLQRIAEAEARERREAQLRREEEERQRRQDEEQRRQRESRGEL